MPTGQERASRRHRELAGSERQSLLEFHRTGAITASVQILLTAIWSARQWIACDCRAEQAPAVMFVQRITGGDWVLVRMSDRPPHGRECPFADKPVAPDPIAPHKLEQLLFRWLNAAKLNILFPYDAQDLLQSQYVSLREAARSLDLEPGRRLYDYSRSHLQGLPELCRRLKRRAPPSAHRSSPWGVYLTLVRAATPIHLRAALDHPEVNLAELWAQEGANALHTRVVASAQDSGPQVALFRLEPSGPQGAIRVTEVFHAPVYSRRYLIPVDEPHERRTLRLLLDLQRYLAESRQVVMSIRKSLPGTAVHDRGIAFQLQRIGPNGRAIRTLEVLCIDGRSTPETDNSLVDNDMVYHRVMTLEGVLTTEDVAFNRVLMDRLLESIEAPALAQEGES